VDEQILTLRDEIWNEVLTEVSRMGYFKISDLGFTESERHTVRRTLKSMEATGWLQRRNERAAQWCLGEKAETNLNASRHAIQEAQAVLAEE
jgi:DNA-binding transcriptional regulator PaaX